jgi:hypothetical protein
MSASTITQPVERSYHRSNRALSASTEARADHDFALTVNFTLGLNPSRAGS